MTTEFVGPVTLASGATTQGRIRVSAENPLPVTGAISGTVTATADAQANAADQVWSEGSSNPFSTDLAGYLRAKAKQSGTWIVGLDQSTPGTTNAVDVTNFPFAVDVNSGNKSNSTVRVVLATDQPVQTNPQPRNITQIAGNAVAAAGANVPGGTLPVQDADGCRIAAASVTSATTVIGPFDTQGYASGSIDISSVGTGCTIILEGSNDWNGTTGTFFQVYSSPNYNGSVFSNQFLASGGAGLNFFPCLARYYRVRVSVYGSGTVTAGAYLRKASFSYQQTMITGGTGQFVGTGSTGNNSTSIGAAQWNLSNSQGLTVLPSTNGDAVSSLVTLAAAGAATLNSSDLLNNACSALNLGINLTTMTAASVTVTIQGKDVVSGQYYTILQSGALTGTGFALLQIGKGLTAAANSAANAVLPRVWRIQAVISNNGGSAAVTGTIGASIVS